MKRQHEYFLPPHTNHLLTKANHFTVGRLPLAIHSSGMASVSKKTQISGKNCEKFRQKALKFAYYSQTRITDPEARASPEKKVEKKICIGWLKAVLKLYE